MGHASRTSLLALAVVLAAGCASAAAPAPRSTPRSADPGASGPSRDPGRTPPLTGASNGPGTGLPTIVDIEESGAIGIEATYAVDTIALAGGRAWVTGMGDGIGVLDGTGRLTRSVPVEGACGAMDVGFDAIWISTCEPGGLVRIDERLAAAERMTLDEPVADPEGSVAAGEGAVWEVAGRLSDRLLAVDPATLEVRATFDVADGSAGVRAGFGGVWVTRPGADVLQRVDPTSGHVVSIAVRGGPRRLALSGDAIWVLGSRDGTVSRIDPATNTVAATIELGAPVEGGDIAVGGGSVWVRGGAALLTRIDPATDTVTARYGPAGGPGGVAAGDNAVWVTAPDAGMVWFLPLG